ncbi:MAG TPA: EAL domain-containing protein [Casimicrobiaceae bacterium]|nr:EAL domain-containing protein [Casimicrobiaceae bacterium]
MPLENIYVARQPIVNAANELTGFELLFRSTEDNAANIADSIDATSTVIANVFTEIGISEVLGEHDGYLNVDTEFLFSELIEALPPKRIVLELMETKSLEGATLQRLRDLRGRGYRVALSDFVGNFDDLGELMSAVDVVKLDMLAIDEILLPEVVGMLRPLSKQLVAQKVETPEQFETAKKLGIKLFQGYHFARPQVLTGRRAKPAKLALLRLLTLALNDAETRQIEDEFKRHPNLAINLLRLVNSVALSRGQTITSLRHALVVLGRRQLRVWLQLLLYTADRGNGALATPLLQLAAVRGKLMELVMAHQPGPDSELKELAFITGVLSLMDVLLEMPIENVLKELNLPEPVAAALLERKGDIGALLTLAENLERDDTQAVGAALAKVGSVDRNELATLQLSAFQWANQVTAAV